MNEQGLALQIIYDIGSRTRVVTLYVTSQWLEESHSTIVSCPWLHLFLQLAGALHHLLFCAAYGLYRTKSFMS